MAKLLYDCPMYNMKAGDEVKMYNQVINERDLLRYGEYLVDDSFYDIDERLIDDCIETRIRIIKYNNTLYYHKMIDDECVECKESK